MTNQFDPSPPQLSPHALEGVRVLDLSRVLAGPFCTMFLGDLGAEVIKIEEPLQGDETRSWGPPWVDRGGRRMSAYFQSVNRNKKSLAVDLKRREGRELVRRLAVGSQILVENFKPGGLQRLGLSYQQMKAANSSLVYCSISGFGHDGPFRDRPGYDTVIQAMSGLMSITGPPEGPPCKVGVAISDVLTGLYAATSILAALRHAESTGQGQWLDLALLDSQMGALVNVAANYLSSGRTPARYGNQHANIVPYQPFEACDQSFMLAVGNDAQFARLCRVLKRPELAQDPRFQDNQSRVAHRGELVPLLATRFAERRANEWVELLLTSGVPAGPIQSVSQALEGEHAAARGLVQECEGARMVGPVPRLSRTPPQIQLPPPHLGEHTREILGDALDLPPDQIEALRHRRVVAVASDPVD